MLGYPLSNRTRTPVSHWWRAPQGFGEVRDLSDERFETQRISGLDPEVGCWSDQYRYVQSSRRDKLLQAYAERQTLR